MPSLYRQTRPTFVLAVFSLIFLSSSLSFVAARTTTYDDGSPQLSYSPSESWEVSASSGDVHWYDGGGTYTSSPGAKLRLVFAGEQLSIFGRSSAPFDVAVDGKPLRFADVYNLSTSASGTVSERLYLATNLSRSEVHEAVLEMKGEGTLLIDRVAVAYLTATDCLPRLFDDDSVGRACTTTSSAPTAVGGSAPTTIEAPSSSGSEVKSTVASSRTTISSSLFPPTSSPSASRSSSTKFSAPSAPSAPTLTTNHESASSLLASTSPASHSSATASSLSTFSTLTSSSSISANSSSAADNSAGGGVAASASDKVGAKEAGGIAVGGLAALGLALFAFCLCRHRRGREEEDRPSMEERAVRRPLSVAPEHTLNSNPQRSSIFGLLIDAGGSAGRNPFSDPTPSQPTFAARPLSLCSDSSIVSSSRPRQIPHSVHYASAATLSAASNRNFDDAGSERPSDITVAAVTRSRSPPSTPQIMEARWRTEGASLARGLTDREVLQVMPTDGTGVRKREEREETKAGALSSSAGLQRPPSNDDHPSPTPATPSPQGLYDLLSPVADPFAVDDLPLPPPPVVLQCVRDSFSNPFASTPSPIRLSFTSSTSLPVDDDTDSDEDGDNRADNQSSPFSTPVPDLRSDDKAAKGVPYYPTKLRVLARDGSRRGQNGGQQQSAKPTKLIIDSFVRPVPVREPTFTNDNPSVPRPSPSVGKEVKSPSQDDSSSQKHRSVVGLIETM